MDPGANVLNFSNNLLGDEALRYRARDACLRNWLSHQRMESGQSRTDVRLQGVHYIFD